MPRAKSSAGGETKWVFPLEKKAKVISTVKDHNSRPLGNWQSDNAVDLANPPGTAWIAVEDGVISRSLGWGESSGHGTVYGFRLHLEGKSGNTYFYQHGGSNLAKAGKRVKQGDKIGEIGDYRHKVSIPMHLHFATKPPLSPNDVIKGGTITSGGGDSRGGNSASGVSVAEAEKISKAAAFATYINLPGLGVSLESQALKGDRSLMNDQPLLPFVQQLAQGCLRSFMSMPNGDFYAFYPDYFGGLGHRTAYWDIEDIEIIDGQIDLSDEALATHVYTVGDNAGFWDGVDVFDEAQTRGVVTILTAFQADFLNPPLHRKKDDPGYRTLSNHDAALAFLKKYGARPSFEKYPMVRSPIYEQFLAYQQFCLLWSRQFLSQFTLTFMPEVYPGGIVRFPSHGLQMYVDEVNHVFDYETGFVTQVNFSAPASLPSADRQNLHAGMIRAGALDPDRK